MVSDLPQTSPVADEILIPITGELVPVMEPTRVALALREVRQLKQDLDVARRALEDALLDEWRRQGTKTLHLDGVTAEIKERKNLVWDIERLGELHELGLPEDRYDALVKIQVAYKVDARVAKQLEAANDEYARVIQAARSEEPASYYVDVK